MSSTSDVLLVGHIDCAHVTTSKLISIAEGDLPSDCSIQDPLDCEQKIEERWTSMLKSEGRRW